MSVQEEVRNIAQRSKAASRVMRGVGGAKINELLEAIATALEAGTPEILAANARDLETAKAHNMAVGLQDRLKLDADRVKALANAVRDIKALKTPIGETLWGRVQENGLNIEQIRVPMGVVAMIYEARPNVTVDAAALSLKTK